MLTGVVVAMAVAAVFAGCTPAGVKERMDRAEAVMYAEPDSALALMREIPAGFRGSRDDKARYALLMTEALYKGLYKDNIKVTDDSLIHIAVDYYANDFANLNRVKAYYYQGIIDINNENYAEAIVSMLHAEKSAKELENHLWLGRIYRGIADAFDEVWDQSSALDYYIHSLDEFLLDGKNEYIGYAYGDVARSYFNSFQYEKAIEMSKITIERAKDEKRVLLESIAMRNIGKSYVELCDWTKAMEFFKPLIAMGSEYVNGQDWMNLGICYLELGDLEMAKCVNDTILKNYPDEDWLTYRIDWEEGNYKNAIEILHNAMLQQNKAMEFICQRNLSAVIAGYYKLQEDSMKKSIEKERQTKTIIVIVSIFALALIVILFRHRIIEYRGKIERGIMLADNLREIIFERNTALQKQEETITALNEESASSKNELEKANKIIKEREKAETEAHNEVKRLLSSRFEMLDKLCATYYQFDGMSNQREKIYLEVEKIINGMKSDKALIAGLESTLNMSINGLMDRFRKEFPTFHEWEKHLYLFMVLGFSARAISIFQGVKIDVVYTRKSALKRKIKASNSPYKDEFLAYMGG